jgi:hypothetical protein
MSPTVIGKYAKLGKAVTVEELAHQVTLGRTASEATMEEIQALRDRLPKLQSLAEHLAVTLSHCRRLEGEKALLVIHARDLQRQLDEANRELAKLRAGVLGIDLATGAVVKLPEPPANEKERRR